MSKKMKVLYKDKIFWVQADYTENNLLMRYGFQFDRKRKLYYTKFADVFAKLGLHNMPEAIRKCVEDKQKEELLEETLSGIGHVVEPQFKIPMPKGVDLFPFQIQGVHMMCKKENVLSADDMGLGKTPQSIAFLNLDPRAPEKKILLLCPASLKWNWVNEIKKFSIHEYKIGMVNTGDSSRLPITKNFWIVNYDLIARIKPHIETMYWDYLIMDECHYLKNSSSARSKAVLGGVHKEKIVVDGVLKFKYEAEKPIKAKKVIAITGTPVLNKPIEIYPILHYLDKSSWPNKNKFAARYCGLSQGRFGWSADGATNLDELNKRLRQTVMIRRTKEQVLKELPGKMRSIVVVKPEEEEARYLVEEKEMIDRMKTEHGMDDEHFVKAVLSLSFVGTTTHESIFALRHRLAESKVPRVIERIEQRLEETKKIVVFAYHKVMIDGIKKHFKDKALVLSGETPVAKRQEIVDTFQKDPYAEIFIGQIKTAGVGITLTAANMCIFAEADFVPGVLTQAEDRLCRIGQKQMVLVEHIVYEGSLDAQILQVVVNKQNIIDQILVNKSEQKLIDALF